MAGAGPIFLRAERKAGELLTAMEQAKGIAGASRPPIRRSCALTAIDGAVALIEAIGAARPRAGARRIRFQRADGADGLTARSACRHKKWEPRSGRAGLPPSVSLNVCPLRSCFKMPSPKGLKSPTFSDLRISKTPFSQVPPLENVHL